MSAALSDAPTLPHEVWRGSTSIFHVAVTVDPTVSPTPVVWRLGATPEMVPPNDPHGTHAATMALYAEAMRAEVLTFQRACGCIDGATLSGALANIKSILRDGEGWPSPIEGIPDIAERVVKERNWLRHAAERMRAWVLTRRDAEREDARIAGTTADVAKTSDAAGAARAFDEVLERLDALPTEEPRR